MDIADRLYGGTAPPASQAPAPAPALAPTSAPAPVAGSPTPPAAVPPAAAAAMAPAAAPAAPAPTPASTVTPDVVAGSVPEEVRQLRAEASRKLYGGEVALEKVLPDKLFAGDGVDAAAQVAVAKEVRAMAADLGMNSDDVALIQGAYAQATATPPTEEQRVANREQITDALNAKYGQGARQAWLDARKFVALDPRSAAMLAPVGDDPTTVLRVVQLAQSATSADQR